MKKILFFLVLFLPLSVSAATFATFDPLNCSGNVVLSNGNLTVTGNGTSVGESCLTTVSKNTGKWYWEYTIGLSGAKMSGIGNVSTNLASYLGGDNNSLGYFSTNGNLYFNGVNNAYGATYVNGDVISIALDLDGGTITFYKNGVTQNSTTTLPTGALFGGASFWNSETITANFGASAFAYSVPAGYNAGLCAESTCGGGGGGVTTTPILSAGFDNFINQNYTTLELLGASVLTLGFFVGLTDFLHRAKKELRV